MLKVLSGLHLCNFAECGLLPELMSYSLHKSILLIVRVPRLILGPYSRSFGKRCLSIDQSLMVTPNPMAHTLHWSDLWDV